MILLCDVYFFGCNWFVAFPHYVVFFQAEDAFSFSQVSLLNVSFKPRSLEVAVALEAT